MAVYCHFYTEQYSRLQRITLKKGTKRNAQHSQMKQSTCTATADKFLCASAEEGDILSAPCCWQTELNVGRPWPEERESRL